jgi:hypothetical protein
MLQKLFYFLILPLLSFVFIMFQPITSYFLSGISYQTSPLIDLILLGLSFPAPFTSLIASATATATQKPFKKFLFFWIISSFVAFLFDLIYRTAVSGEPIFYFTFFIPWELLGVIAAGIVGVTIGRVIVIAKERRIKIPKNPKLVKRYLLNTVLLLFLFSLFLSLFTGVFVNTVDSNHSIDPYHYYIHRGLPIPFSGLTRQGFTPPYPIMTLPFFSEKLDKDTFIKSIHLFKFFQSLGFYMLLSLLPALSFANMIRTRKQYIILIVTSVCILSGMFFLWGRVIV